METGFNDLLLFGQNPFMESRALNITVKWITQGKEGKATYSQDQFYEGVLQKCEGKMYICFQL